MQTNRISEMTHIPITFFPISSGTILLGTALRQQIPHPLGHGYAYPTYLDNDSGWYYLGLYDGGARHGLARWHVDAGVTELLWSSTGLEYQRPLTLTCLSRDLPSTYEQTIPILVRAPGRRGTHWTSDLWLYNPSSTSTQVTLRRVVKPEVSKVVELPAHGSTKISDALTWLGGGTGGDGVTHDAVVLTSPYRWGEQVVAVSRVWTPSLDPDERARGGTMGQAVPAVPGTTGYSNHLRTSEMANPGSDGEMHTGKEAVWVLDHREPGRFRHNAGFVNDRDHEVTVTLWWGWGDGLSRLATYAEWAASGARHDLTLAPHSVTLVNIESLFSDSVRRTYPAQLGVSGSLPVAMWLSQVDNRTGDGIHVPYTLYWMTAAPGSSVAIPAVAHLPGAGGTHWVSDLYYSGREYAYGESNIPKAYLDTPAARFLPAWAGRCGGAADPETASFLLGVAPSARLEPPGYDWPYGYRNIFPDVVRRFPACAEETNVRGALEVRTASWMAGYARTYTTRADGGTYGEMLPFYPPYGWPVQHFAGLEISPRFRINLGLYNGNTEHAIVHRPTLYAADGTKVAERELTLQPRANLVERLEDLLGLARGSFAEGSYGLTVLPLDDDDAGVQGRSWAFVSVVDNVTGDPTNWW